MVSPIPPFGSFAYSPTTHLVQGDRSHPSPSPPGRQAAGTCRRAARPPGTPKPPLAEWLRARLAPLRSPPSPLLLSETRAEALRTLCDVLLRKRAGGS